MALEPLDELDFSMTPIGGGVDGYEPTQDWSKLAPTIQTKPDLLASINEIAGRVGTIFDAGWSVYEKIAGRTTANEQIAGETVGAEKTPIIIQQPKGFYEIYAQNKTSVFLIGGGLVLLTMTLLIKKVR